jgi:hypothetical protein
MYKLPATTAGTLESPTTFVIDRDGTLKRRYVGPTQWDAPAALDHFRNLTEGTPWERAGLRGEGPRSASRAELAAFAIQGAQRVLDSPHVLRLE